MKILGEFASDKTSTGIFTTAKLEIAELYWS